MKFISIRKLKFYTKETLKFFNITLIALGFVIAILIIKYKPMYEVKISGEEVGYINNKDELETLIENNIYNYSGKNIYDIKLTENPEYELKLVEKTKESNESEILIALQKNLDITYNYYELGLNDEIIEKVDSLQTAEQIANELKEKDIELTINEKTTQNIDELEINSLEVAKKNVIEKLDIDTIDEIAEINSIKIATLPVDGIVSSRYGENSRIRSSTHTGLDIAATMGTQIKVVADGTVTFASRNGSYGNLVKVDHGNGVETWYAHTSKMYVEPGQKVKAGDVIALVGSTGNSTGPHLHLELRINGQHVDPQKYIYLK